MASIAYHHTVNELQGLGLVDAGPFGSAAWFRLLEQSVRRARFLVVSEAGEAVVFPLIGDDRQARALTNWYAFTWAPLASLEADNALYQAAASALRGHAVVLDKLEHADADRLERAFREAGFAVRREQCDTNHYLSVADRSFAEYLAARPGPLRTTLKRKARKVAVRLARRFDAADWEAYEAIYSRSWKPAEGDRALLRGFAKAESAAGHYLLGIASADGAPVAAQFWTVQDGKAYIHKLAHLTEAEALSPGTTLTAALMEEVIDRDRVAEIDFGTGDDGYKADWMEAVRPRWRLTCLDPRQPRHWPGLAKAAARAGLRQLVSSDAAA